MANFSLHGINLDDMISTPSLSYESLISLLYSMKAISVDTYLSSYNDIPAFLMDREG